MINLHQWGIESISRDQNVIIQNGQALEFVECNSNRCTKCYFHEKVCQPIPCSYTAHEQRIDGKKGYFSIKK